jgi:hypothetical protein
VPFYCAQDYEKIRSVYGAVLSKFAVNIRVSSSRTGARCLFKINLTPVTSYHTHIYIVRKERERARENKDNKREKKRENEMVLDHR